MPSALGAMVAPRAWLTDYRIVGLKQKVRKIIDTTGTKWGTRQYLNMGRLTEGWSGLLGQVTGLYKWEDALS